MRLVRIEVSGYRRFLKTSGKCRLEIDGPLIAIVGPNEAGKTSLLRAACRLDDDDPIANTDRTRLAGIADDHEVLEALYLIEDRDCEVLSDLHGASDPALTRWFVAHKYAGGQRTYEVLPGLVRDRRSRRDARNAMSRLVSHPGWSPHAEALGDERVADAAIAAASGALASEAETLSPDEHAAIQSFRDVLATHEWEGTTMEDRVGASLAALSACLEAEATEHPNVTAAARLVSRRPHFLFFGDEQRNLQTDYELAEVVDQTPEALDNLVRLAGLDLQFLYNLITGGDSGTAVSELNNANDRLRAAFEDWSQSRTTTVRIDREGDTVIRLHVSREAGGFDRLDERSDGLRMFVALLAVTARSNFAVPPIVVIDELERHLHYDAQADVVQLFARQEEIPQMVYTTHSAGCLPEDLGAGIRSVHQVAGTNNSDIINRFWTTVGTTASVGFSPLLLGMGASTLAFVPIRHAVLTEGATDLVLLPTLVREATGKKAVGFQVAPASAESPVAHIAGLDREAARVAWLVDGDSSGGDLANAVTSQLGPERLVHLAGASSGKVLEDLLLPSVYAQAINAQLARSGIEPRITRDRLERVNSPRGLAEWCEEHGVAEPNKMDVANRVLDLRHDVPKLLSNDGARILRDLDERVRSIFESADS